jgi:hypothetical protein
MPSNLDILAASDFSRAFSCFQQTIVRLKRGDETDVEAVLAVVEIDSKTAQSENYQNGGQTEGERNEKIRAARIEVAADQQTYSTDQWEFDGTLWKSVGEPEGEDAGTKTIIVKSIKRHRGRKPTLNT